MGKLYPFSCEGRTSSDSSTWQFYSSACSSTRASGLRQGCKASVPHKKASKKRLCNRHKKAVVQVDVQELLNGVDLEGTRREDRREGLAEMREESVRVFISYAHKDEWFRLALEPHLKLLQRQRLIAMWHDRLIKPGAEWKDVIDANLEHAKIILLLVSADFIASDYCWEIEMKRALERHEKGEARVIPVIIRAVKWDTAPFAKLQALPEKGKAVDLWQKKDQAWRSVADGIEKVAAELRKKKNARLDRRD